MGEQELDTSTTSPARDRQNQLFIIPADGSPRVTQMFGKSIEARDHALLHSLHIPGVKQLYASNRTGKMVTIIVSRYPAVPLPTAHVSEHRTRVAKASESPVRLNPLARRNIRETNEMWKTRVNRCRSDGGRAGPAWRFRLGAGGGQTEERQGRGGSRCSRSATTSRSGRSSRPTARAATSPPRRAAAT